MTKIYDPVTIVYSGRICFLRQKLGLILPVVWQFELTSILDIASVFLNINIECSSNEVVCRP